MSQAAEQQANRTRFSFGPVWNKNVIDGKVKDEAKLRQQALKLKVGTASAVKSWKFDTLLAKVGAALKEGAGATPAEAKAKPARKSKAKAVEQEEPAAA